MNAFFSTWYNRHTLEKNEVCPPQKHKQNEPSWISDSHKEYLKTLAEKVGTGYIEVKSNQ